ncbi:MAG: M48 family metalloprotease [Planctomycetia bacterium]|nr:M48 family metalloprotease [Planctomycetia bacterium]
MASRATTRQPVLALRAAYYPFLAAVCVLPLLAALALVLLAAHVPRAASVIAFCLAILLSACAIHVLAAFRFYRRRPSQDAWEFELPPAWHPALTALAHDVANRHKLTPPDVIRVHVEDAAYVWQDDRGRRVLVLGALTIANFSQSAVAGIVAHELAHLTAGDTELTQTLRGTVLLMGLLDAVFAAEPLYMANPLAWLLRGYHRLFALVFAANRRLQEFDADRFEVQQVGADACAKTSILLEALEILPWSRLHNVAESCLAVNVPLPQIFSEQMARARRTTTWDWQDACRKALARNTAALDSHPCLRERLAAIGVPPRRAIDLAGELDLAGPPARDLFVNWPVVEKFLSEKIVSIVREDRRIRQEIAQIGLGRPW